MDIRTAALIAAMTAFDRGDTLRIQHFIKVHDLSMTIGVLEGMSEEDLKKLEAASVLHDVGIHPALAKYGNCAGPHQEELGPVEAEKIMKEINEILPEQQKYTPEEIDRVKFLIGHHHTYSGIDSMDWQVLVEADFLVNLFEDNSPMEYIQNVRNNIFKTKAGTDLLDQMFTGRRDMSRKLI